MIIQFIRAENFRKYDVLNLSNIPPKGLIFLLGTNESGKTSIGEAITFVLFGFTERVPQEAAAKLIRWGSKKAQVQLGFIIRGKRFHLNRSINRKGQVLASLWDADNEIALAGTPDEVDAMLKGLLGYGYRAFIRSFYWSQQVHEAEQMGSEDLRAMAGLQVYQHIHEKLTQEHGATLKRTEALEHARQKTIQAIADFDFDEKRLAWLQEVRAELREMGEIHTNAALGIDTETKHYITQYERYHHVKQYIGRINQWALTGIFTILILLLLAVFSGTNLNWLSAIDIKSYQSSIVAGAALLALFSGAGLFYSLWLEKVRLNPMHEKGGALLQRLFTGYKLMKAPLEQQLNPATVDWLQMHNIPPEDRDKFADMRSLGAWVNKVEHFGLEPWDVRQVTDGLSVNLVGRQQTVQELLTHVDEDIQGEQLVTEQYQALMATQQKQTNVLQDSQYLLQVQVCSQGLLERSTQHTIKRFNQVVGGRCQTLLDEFTQGQYQKLKMRGDFSLQVLSQEKGNYLDFDEVSAGTQRQIALAMRVALARVLVDSTNLDKQFLFLDESFIFFDVERMQATLHSLLTSSQQTLSQIWMTAQDLPQGAEVALEVHCSTGCSVLDIGGESKARRSILTDKTLVASR